MPQNLQFVLDNLGTPPPEVALDWARQVAEIASQSSSDESTDQRDMSTLSAAELQWSRFEVDEAGRVTIARTPTATGDTNSAGHQGDPIQKDFLGLAAQLVVWSDCEAALSDLADRVSYDRLTEIIDRRIAALERSKNPGLSPSGSGRKNPGRSSVSAGKRSESAGPSARPALKLVAMSVLGVAVLGLVGWVAASTLFRGSNEEPLATRPFNQQPGPEAASNQAGATSAELPSGEKMAVELKLSADADERLGSFEPGATTAELPQAGNPLSELGQLSELRPIAESTEVPGAADSATSEMETVDVASNQEASRDGSTTNAEIPSGGLPTDNSAAMDATVDVTGELERLAKPTEEESVTTVEIAQVDGLELPALNVAIFPSLQKVSLELPRDIRLRKPEVELQLQVSDGFSVAPNNSVAISSNQGALWNIQAEDDELSVVVLVAAKLTTGRSPTLRFQISASSPETPGVVVPLSRDYLERAESLLSGIRNQLTLGIDTIRRSYDATPKELRAVMTARRKAAEQQLAICEKLFKLATEASRAEGLLDGQFELCGRILETSGEASKVVATFGEPTTIISSDANHPDDQ